MKKFLKIILGIVVIIGILVGVIVMVTSGDRDIARNFVTWASAGQYEEARELLHSELQKEFNVEKLQASFEGVKPYTEVSFGSVETASGRGTTMEGSASTEDGCTSKVSFEVLNDKIIAFNINPLCRE